MSQHKTNLNDVFGVHDGFERSELYVAEHIFLNSNENQLPIPLPGILVCFNQVVWFFDEKYRFKVTDQINVWRNLLHRQIFEREFIIMRLNEDRPPRLPKYSLEEMWIGLTDYHEEIIVVDGDMTIEEAFWSINGVIVRFFTPF